MKVSATPFLTIEPDSIEMIFGPGKGQLDTQDSIENGFQYVPDGFDFAGDSFALIAKHAYYKASVLLYGEIRDDDSLVISYQILDDGEKFKGKDGSDTDDNPIDNGNGTVTFPYPPGMKIDITGTIVCKPSFPDGTIIFGLPGVNSGVIAGDQAEVNENGIGLQELANKTGRSVVANEDQVWVRYWRWGSINWGRFGKWIEIAPKFPMP